MIQIIHICFGGWDLHDDLDHTYMSSRQVRSADLRDLHNVHTYMFHKVGYICMIQSLHSCFARRDIYIYIYICVIQIFHACFVGQDLYHLHTLTTSQPTVVVATSSSKAPPHQPHSHSCTKKHARRRLLTPYGMATVGGGSSDSGTVGLQMMSAAGRKWGPRRIPESILSRYYAHVCPDGICMIQIVHTRLPGWDRYDLQQILYTCMFRHR